jgi:hypothetical protein
VAGGVQCGFDRHVVHAGGEDPLEVVEFLGHRAPIVGHRLRKKARGVNLGPEPPREVEETIGEGAG